MRKRIIIYLVFMILFVTLFLDFYSNCWGIIPKNWFEVWQKDSEQLVINSLEKAKVYGFWYNYGLLGDYHQQIGLQGIFLRVINIIIAPSSIPLQLYYGLFVGIFCVLVCYLIYWSWLEFGICSGIFLYFCVLFNRWLIVSVKNLYWTSFLFLLPFVCMLILCKRDEKKKANKSLFLFVPLITIFLKAACGFEMISTVMVSMEMPVFYYAIKNQWSTYTIITKFLLSFMGAMLAFLSTLIVNFLQQTFLLSSFKKAFDNIIYTISKRTGAFNVKVGEIYQESLNASKISVIDNYFRKGEPIFGNMHMLSISIFLAGLTVFSCKTYLRKKNIKLKSLCICMWLSFLAPLSWLVLATPHSFIHRDINYIAWSYPCLLLAAIWTGGILDYFLKLKTEAL